MRAARRVTSLAGRDVGFPLDPFFGGHGGDPRLFSFISRGFLKEGRLRGGLLLRVSRDTGVVGVGFGLRLRQLVRIQLRGIGLFLQSCRLDFSAKRLPVLPPAAPWPLLP